MFMRRDSITTTSERGTDTSSEKVKKKKKNGIGQMMDQAVGRMKRSWQVMKCLDGRPRTLATSIEDSRVIIESRYSSSTGGDASDSQSCHHTDVVKTAVVQASMAAENENASDEGLVQTALQVSSYNYDGVVEQSSNKSESRYEQVIPLPAHNHLGRPLIGVDSSRESTTTAPASSTSITSEVRRQKRLWRRCRTSGSTNKLSSVGANVQKKKNSNTTQVTDDGVLGWVVLSLLISAISSLLKFVFLRNYNGSPESSDSIQTYNQVSIEANMYKSGPIVSHS